MSEPDERARPSEAGCEPVHVENGWYDGTPRSGLAAIGGLPHYFEYADDGTGAGEEYLVWPADPVTLEREQEQWVIFCAWNARYESGEAGIDTHPGNGGVDPRYDALQTLLVPCRRPPSDARRMVPEWCPRERPGGRYLPEGPDYGARWRPAGPEPVPAPAVQPRRAGPPAP